MYQSSVFPLFAGGRAALFNFILHQRNWGTNVIAHSVMLSYFEVSFLIDLRQNCEVVICLCHSSPSSSPDSTLPSPHPSVSGFLLLHITEELKMVQRLSLLGTVVL